jgi:hypothetical protein
MTIRADLWDRSLTREELFSMTTQAGCVFRKLGDVRERGVAFAHLFPVFGRKLVTRATREFLFRNVSGMRKVIRAGLRKG